MPEVKWEAPGQLPRTRLIYIIQIVGIRVYIAMNDEIKKGKSIQHELPATY